MKSCPWELHGIKSMLGHLQVALVESDLQSVCMAIRSYHSVQRMPRITQCQATLDVSAPADNADAYRMRIPLMSYKTRSVVVLSVPST